MTSDTKTLLLRQLEEAHATEQALVTNLRAHIAMTPRGSYRDSLERHLSGDPAARAGGRAPDPRDRARPRRPDRRLRRGHAPAIGQALVLTKGPLDLVRGGPRGEEKLLKNARDEVVTEALEIAIYDVIEALATSLGDNATARLAASHRADEEQMLGELRGHLPRLAEAVAEARAGGSPSYDWASTGAAETVKRKAKTTRRPRVSKTQPPTSDYDRLTASEVVGKLTDFTQSQLADAVAYERANRKRTTVIDRAHALQEDEPFSGYDELTARDVAQRLTDADEPTARRVREYEGRHRRRVEVLEAAQRQLSGASS